MKYSLFPWFHVNDRQGLAQDVALTKAVHMELTELRRRAEHEHREAGFEAIMGQLGPSRGKRRRN